MRTIENKAKNVNPNRQLPAINLADVHLGKLAWPEADTAPHQDTVMAQNICEEALKAQKAKPFNQCMHLLPWGEEALGL
jgi:hypothetical protein